MIICPLTQGATLRKQSDIDRAVKNLMSFAQTSQTISSVLCLPHAPGGVCPMTFHSILFKRTEEKIKKETLEAPVFFVDLNLDQVIDAITAGKREYN